MAKTKKERKHKGGIKFTQGKDRRLDAQKTKNKNAEKNPQTRKKEEIICCY